MHSLLQPGILFLFYSYINMTGNSQLQDDFPLLSCLYIHIYIYIKKNVLPSCFLNFLDMLGWGAFHLILLCPYACVGLARFFWPPNEWSCMTSGFRGYCAFVCLPFFPDANAHGCLFLLFHCIIVLNSMGSNTSKILSGSNFTLYHLPVSLLSSLPIFFW